MEKLVDKFNNKKSIENLVIFLILLIIVFVVINNLTKPIEKSEAVASRTRGTSVKCNVK